ncbi:MAG: amino acid permease [Sedimentisphaerales bacterium]|nr:amino acid permease [Sedimentisphaerales bacterium]
MKTQPKRQLSIFDSICIIVGIIIGAGIYETAPTVAACMKTPTLALAIWGFGGLIALAGALCYSELATAYPYQGGDYVYLTRAYGKPVGFLFGFSQLAVVRPGDITLMAFIFGRYAQQLYQLKHGTILYTAVSIIALTFINILGVRQGKWTQNILTVVKTLALAAIIAVGLFAKAPPAALAETASTPTLDNFKLALILVMFTFGGWNEMAYVAAEIKNPKRNIFRALATGTVAVTVLYVLVNFSFLHALGLPAASGSQAVAVDTIATALPHLAGRAFAVIICISALGAINGLIFTGARISYALGSEHRLFAWLGVWNNKRGVPIYSLVIQALVALLIVFCAGSFVDTIIYSAPVVWIFFLLTGISTCLLRRKEPHTERPFKLPFFPLPVLIFCLTSTFMLYSCVTFAWSQKPNSLFILAAVMLIGVILCFVDRSINSPAPPAPTSPPPLPAPTQNYNTSSNRPIE